MIKKIQSKANTWSDVKFILLRYDVKNGSIGLISLTIANTQTSKDTVFQFSQFAIVSKLFKKIF